MEFGTHCSLENCQQLDFLPFVCEACARVFCKEHSKPEQHECSCYGESTKQLDETTLKGTAVINRFPCERRDCHRSELVPVKCEHCHMNFCIIHRHPDDHNCCQLPTASGTNVTKRSHPLQNSPHKHKGVGRRSEKCSQMVGMMRLKQKAKGPPSVDQAHRVYYSVTLPNGDTMPLYFSKEWSVGKVIDQIAAMFKFGNKYQPSLGGPQLMLLSSHEVMLDTKLPLSDQQNSGTDIQLVYR